MRHGLLYRGVPPALGRLRFKWDRVITAWLFLLNDAAGRAALKIPAGNPALIAAQFRFREGHREVKEELGRFFTSYLPICAACASSCCLLYYHCVAPSPSRPSSWMDNLLYGRSRDELMAPTRRNGRNAWRAALKYILRVRGANEACPDRLESSGPKRVLLPCPELTEGGCRLPWRDRPSGCILHWCEELARGLTWRDYGRYIRLSAKYLLLLTLALKGLGAELTD